jgi:hypothetical protein
MLLQISLVRRELSLSLIISGIRIAACVWILGVLAVHDTELCSLLFSYYKF